ncbi:MAG: hypothetical protein HYV09_25575 [Deltaproteobacteria bacterium]|nr:hypothetical protein [Deltaproteobacteria bacterium]
MKPQILIVVAACIGCHGAELDSAPRDASPGDAGPGDAADGGVVVADSAGEGSADAAEDAACVDDVAGNLLSNGSFERGLEGWSDGRLVVVDGDADHCDRWAKLVDGEAWTSVSQRVAVSAPAGTTFELGMSLRAIDSTTAAVQVFVATDDETGESRPPLAPAGSWIRTKATVVTSKPITSLIIGFRTEVATKRSVGIDRVWLVKK